MSFNYGEQPAFHAQELAVQPLMPQPIMPQPPMTPPEMPAQPIMGMEQTFSALAENQHPIAQPLSADQIFAPVVPAAPIAPVEAPILAQPESNHSLSARVAEMEARNEQLELDNAMLRSDIAALQTQCAELESLRRKAQHFETIADKLQALSAEIAGQ